MIQVKKIRKFDDLLIQKVTLLLDQEIKISIFSNLSANLKKIFLKQFVENETLHLYVCYEDNEIIGCALLGNKPGEYIKGLKKFKFQILLNLLIRFKLVTIFNLFLVYFNLDIIHLNSTIIKKISNNLNLNLIVIKSSHQSKGVGTNFFSKILEDFKSEMNSISLEADNFRSIAFYEKKLDFKIIGKKIRLFKPQTILIKDF